MMKSGDTYRKLAEVLRALASVPDEEIHKLFENGVLKAFLPGEFFIRNGEIPKKYAFVAIGNS